MNWDIVNYIRSLYMGTSYILQEIANLTNEKFGTSIDYRMVHKIVKNKRWKDTGYTPKNTTYRKINSQIKKYILDNIEKDNKVLAESIKIKFQCDITSTRVGQLKIKNTQSLSLIIGT